MKTLIKEAEKEFDEKFVIKGTSKEFEYFRRESGLNASEEATIIPKIKSFIFSTYTEKIVEGIKEEVRKKKYDLDKVFQSEEAKLEAKGYNEAIDDILSLLSSLTDKEK